MTATPSRRPSAGPASCEVIDGVTGKVTASGQLTPQGADLLRGTVEELRRLGHSTIVGDLAAAQVTGDVGVQALRDLRVSMATTGSRLLLQNVSPELSSAS